MKEIGWDDLQVFYHVAEGGGLSGAGRALGLSAATVGRRMLSLEQATGQALFERSQAGYALTGAGAVSEGPRHAGRRPASRGAAVA